MLSLLQINEMIGDIKKTIIEDFKEYDKGKMAIMLERLTLTATYYGEVKEQEERAALLNALNRTK